MFTNNFRINVLAKNIVISHICIQKLTMLQNNENKIMCGRNMRWADTTIRARYRTIRNVHHHTATHNTLNSNKTHTHTQTDIINQCPVQYLPQATTKWSICKILCQRLRGWHGSAAAQTQHNHARATCNFTNVAIINRKFDMHAFTCKEYRMEFLNAYRQIVDIFFFTIYGPIDFNYYYR